MSKQIIIDDGLKTYELVNKNKKVLGEISFNPSDTNIVKRYEEVVEQLEKIDIAFSSEETAEIAEEMRKVDDIIYEKVDYLVGAEISEQLFAVMGPFSPLDSGVFFIEYILEVIGKIISQETGASVKKINKRISKHTKKYHG